MRMFAQAVVVAASLLSGTAYAQGDAVRVAHDAITAGDMARAERLLVAEQRIFPTNPDVLVNLAAVYSATGRAGEATALYRRVLSSDDVLLDLSSDRSVSAHTIAKIGLQRLGSVQTAAR